MPLYVVQAGYTWGLERLPAGSIVELSEREAADQTYRLKLTEVPEEVFRVSLPEEEEEPVDLVRITVPDWMEEPEDSEDWVGLSAAIVDLLEGAGYTPSTVRKASDVQLRTVNGVGPGTLRKIRGRYPQV